MRAEEQMRLRLLHSMRGRQSSGHEGKQVVRWISGGTGPDIRTTFRTEGKHTVMCCPLCGSEFGRVNLQDKSSLVGQMTAIQQAGHPHHCSHDEDMG